MKKILILGLIVFLLSGCGFVTSSTKVVSKIFTVKTNSRYYERKTGSLVDQLVDQMKTDDLNSEIHKVAIMDLANHNGRISVLGRFISLKIMHQFSKKKYFKLVQRGDLLRVVERLNISQDIFDISSSKKLGNALHVEAIISGRIIDLGTNLEVSLNSINIRTGEIIASASESFSRSNFAVQMLRKF